MRALKWVIIAVALGAVLVAALQAHQRLQWVGRIERSTGIELPLWVKRTTLSQAWNGPFGSTVWRIEAGATRVRQLDRSRCGRVVRARELGDLLPSSQLSTGRETPLCILPLQDGGDRDMVIVDRSAIFVVVSD